MHAVSTLCLCIAIFWYILFSKFKKFLFNSFLEFIKKKVLKIFGLYYIYISFFSDFYNCFGNSFSSWKVKECFYGI